MTILMPRLPKLVADELIEDLFEKWREGGLEAIRPFSDLPEFIRFPATGGRRAREEDLNSLRAKIQQIAVECGYPEEDKANRPLFDAELTAYLSTSDLLNSGEMLVDDVWAFISCCLAPEFAFWRFDPSFRRSGPSSDRFAGGIRNTYQRLWMRGRVLDRRSKHPDRWGVVHSLTEDALVQITERPSLGADQKLSLAIGEAWVRASKHFGRGPMEAIMRNAILKIRIKSHISLLGKLPDTKLASLLDEYFGIPEASDHSMKPSSDDHNKSSDESNGEDNIDRLPVQVSDELKNAVERIETRARELELITLDSSRTLREIVQGVTEFSDDKRLVLVSLADSLRQDGKEVESVRILLGHIVNGLDFY